jgi:uncharacterized protein YqgQ
MHMPYGHLFLISNRVWMVRFIHVYIFFLTMVALFQDGIWLENAILLDKENKLCDF